MSEAEIAAATELVVDCAALCRLLRGESDSCSFNSEASETFMAVAMQHLCAGDETSASSLALLPIINEHFAQGLRTSMQSVSDHDSDVYAADDIGGKATTDAEVEEMRGRIREQEATLMARDAELQALAGKAAALARALDARSQQQAPGVKPAPANAPLVPEHLQVIPASELNLDFNPNSGNLLGTGVYSEVYKTTRTVAVKAFRGRFSQQRFREFKQEAEMLQLVQGNSGVVRLHGICIDALPNLYLVTETALGGTLETLLATDGVRGQGLALDHAVAICRCVAGAMRDIHSKGVVHRDLKLSNILLTAHNDRLVKLVDFGLAQKAPSTSGGPGPPADDGAGTPVYQAPEVLSGHGASLPADVYAFGIVMWEIISGEQPFEQLTLPEMKKAVIAGTRPPLRPHWDASWVEVMRSCWVGDPAARPSFATAENMLARVIPQAASLSPPGARAPAGGGQAQSAQEKQAQMRAMLPGLPGQQAAPATTPSPAYPGVGESPNRSPNGGVPRVLARQAPSPNGPNGSNSAAAAAAAAA
eukprot:CAMPEP_0180325582 /NCGR_PEP_ID=MMETSP0988-20121125/38517_1 /TAXON_ID=697907 /ORGANISM="non described non described, Strain CCMP2293" /LENGTH=532 /DNA_ID=CAMNT_0022312053 /DNA_START=65 /DNA_END=1660 /DNA_ORIENTATION=+